MPSLTSPNVDLVREHLCSKDLFGDVAELCETRGDCLFVVTCPDCKRMFSLDEDEYEDLLQWSRSAERSCGIPF